MKNNYLHTLGLAHRAGKCSAGEDTVIKAIQTKKAKLVLLANDIGPQTRKKIIDKCKTYEIPTITVDDRETLGHSIGKSKRVAIAILDFGFARKIQSLLM